MARSRWNLVSSASSFLLAALLSLTLVAMGCDSGGGNTPDEDTVQPPADVQQDVPVGPECETAADCTDLELGACEEAVCNAEGQCEAATIEDCCETADDCTDLELGVCEEAVCNEAHECEAQAIADCCEEDADCNDDDDCTTDTCTDNECVNTAIEDCCTSVEDCDDENECTEDACTDNECVNTAIEDCCTSVEDCDDEDPCTTDACTDNACVNTAIADCCETIDDCDTTGLGVCEQMACTDNECVTSAKENCCENNAQCDDGDEFTQDICCLGVGDPHADCTADNVNTCLPPIPQACGNDTWCQDNWSGSAADFCEEVRCCLATDCQDASGATIEQGSCFMAEIPAPTCCITDNDCEDYNACTIDECVGGAGGHCENAASPDCACSEPQLFVAEFDNVATVAAAGFAIDDSNLDDDVTWNVVHGGAYYGKGIYLGDPVCGVYYNGDHTVVDGACVFDSPAEELDIAPEYNATGISVDLKTNPILLPSAAGGGGLYMLEFFVMGEGEMPHGLPGVPESDALVVTIEDTSDLVGYFNCTSLGHPDYGSCEVFTTIAYDNQIPTGTFVTADLSAWAGREIRVHFDFETSDAAANRYEGWYLDHVEVKGYCTNQRCDGGTACTTENACEDNTCTEFANLSGAAICARLYDTPTCVPCSYAVDCDDSDDCTEESCTDGVCGWTPDSSPECCSPIEVLAEDFETGAVPAEWAIEQDATDVHWQIVTDDETGESYLYFGDSETMTYANGQVAQGKISTEAYDLPDPTQVQVLNLIAYWDVNLSTEFDTIQWDPNVAIDRLTLNVKYFDNTSGEIVTEELWSSVAIEGSTMGEWVMQGVDLMAYAGRNVWFEWVFDSDDANENLYAGAMIDNFNIKTTCTGPCWNDDMCEDVAPGLCWTSTCGADAQCSEPVLAYEGCCETVDNCLASTPCTTVSCVANTCSYQDDGNDTTCCDGSSFETAFEFAELPDTYEVVQEDNGDPANPVTWQIASTSICGEGHGNHLYYGDPANEDYWTMRENGVAGTVLTPEISIPSSGDGAATWIEFDLYLDTEWKGIPREGWTRPTLGRDQLTLSVVQGTVTTPIWDSFGVDLRGSTCNGDSGVCEWRKIQIDVSAYHGYSLQFLFEFDSVDDINNENHGVCIDNLSIASGCTGDDYQCFQSEDCPVEGLPDECYWYYCVDNQCDDEYIGGLNCCDIDVYAASSWESGDENWTYFPSTGDVRWQTADFAEAQDGDSFLYFGNVTDQDYDADGSIAGGEALSPRFVLPNVDAATDSIELSFWYYLDVEEYDTENPGTDAFTVTVINNLSGLETVLITKANIPDVNIGADPIAWHKYSIELTQFAGEDISIQFLFDSGDASNNDGLGVLIDDFQIVTEICD